MNPRSLSRHVRHLDVVLRHLRRASAAGLVHQMVEDDRLDGRTISIGGRRLLHFGSCSYLGLDLDPRLREGAADAIERFGTTFSSSRAYLALGLYDELESGLAAMTGAPVIVTPTTTLGHLAALPVLVAPEDAVLIDRQAHASLHMAMKVVQSSGTTVQTLPHGDTAALEAAVVAAEQRHPTVWYVADGVYSMYGDVAPLGALRALMEEHPRLRCYLDDAHGFSWSGRNGQGLVLEALGRHPQVVVAASLSKSFGASGGALVFPRPGERDQVLAAGGTLTFGGPLPPAALGAGVVAAALHRTEEFAARRDELAARLRRLQWRLRARGLPLVAAEGTPVHFIGLGSNDATERLSRRLREDGVYVNVSAYPAVPLRRAGVRFTVTLHHTEADLDRLVDALGRHVPGVLAADGTSLAEVRARFASAAQGVPRRSATVAA